MADDKQGEQEQSMEEILASIRKIISEDGDEDGQADSVDSGLDLVLMDDDDILETGPTPASVDDDIFDLGDPIEDEFDAVAAEPTDSPEPNVDEVSNYDDDDDELLVIEEEDEFPVDSEVSEPEVEFEPAPAAVTAQDVDSDSLLSPEAAALSASALAALRNGGIEGKMPIGRGDTVECLVQELLRPMLKQWLDIHLPSMVENLVREEIQRIQQQPRD
jgi:cell pole-organizing protein PopZ